MQPKSPSLSLFAYSHTHLPTQLYPPSSPSHFLAASMLYAALIRVYSLCGMLGKAKECLAAAVAAGVSVGLRHYDGLVLAAAAEGRVEDIDTVGKTLSSLGIRRDAMYVCAWKAGRRVLSVPVSVVVVVMNSFA
jgi:hypothetical protein